MKILGQILTSDGKDLEDLNKRKSTKNVMIGRLLALNLNSAHIHTEMKAQMFKTYIRPVLTSGCENMELSGKLNANFFELAFKISLF